MKRLYECQSCQGTGVLNDYAFSVEVEVCPDCTGSGQIIATPLEARVFYGELQEIDEGTKPARAKVRVRKNGVKP